MSLYDVVRPIVFQIDPERAHHLVAGGLSAVDGTPIQRALRTTLAVEDDRLGSEAFGLTFPNPIGVAAGFDKNGTFPGALGALGFGFAEVGGVTPDPREGNPRPRIFRLVEDRGIVNRMGLNNEGAAVVGDRLRERTDAHPVGVNLAVGDDCTDEPTAYRESYAGVAGAGDFYVINVSCPNAEGVRDLQDRGRLEAIVEALDDAGASPLLVKVSPDLSEGALNDVVEVVEQFGLAGLVATNTTTDRPDDLSSAARDQTGGLSGRPLANRSTEVVRSLARRTDKPIVGVGGVFTAADAYEKLRAGASLVQVYTGLIYRGPTVARSINRGLLRLMERDGYGSVENVVGADLE
ncbi:MAG: quinone-dependent dihydroorotate dehydrogenase [Halococcoides sp.]